MADRDQTYPSGKSLPDDEHVTLKVYLLDTINERDRKYEQRFASIDKTISDTNQSIKEALAAALAATSSALDKATENTQNALTTANDNIKAALVALDKRFEPLDEFRQQLAQLQDVFARRSEVEQRITSMKESVEKSEAGNEKRFEAFNNFGNQMRQVQETFARRTEVEIQIKSIADKVDTMERTSERNTGKVQGVSSVGTVVLSVVVGLGALAAVAGLLITALPHVAH